MDPVVSLSSNPSVPFFNFIYQEAVSQGKINEASYGVNSTVGYAEFIKRLQLPAPSRISYMGYDTNRIWEFEDITLYVYVSPWISPTSIFWNISIFAKTSPLLTQYLERVRAILTPLPPEKANDKTTVCFWSERPDGPYYDALSIDTPRWEAQRPNYAPSIQDSLHQLISMEKAPTSGKLILIHGLPGLGKTWYLRSLVREWREWADTHYIIDPERFFGVANYMRKVILPTGNSDRTRLVVIEDADELLRTDAKDRVGQSLSRLLNLTDGFIGQSAQILVLITTNEPLPKIHPALLRPGRCLASLEFKPFTADESMDWVKTKGLDLMPEPREHTLADLYALVNGKTISHEAPKRKIGF